MKNNTVYTKKALLKQNMRQREILVWLACQKEYHSIDALSIQINEI